MVHRVHIIRHAEGVHNVHHDKTILDPELSPHGIEQSKTLNATFPYKHDIGLIITSPLRRTLHTAIEGFHDIIDQQAFIPGSAEGIPNGAPLLLDPDVQAHSDRPCDTGSEIKVLQASFPTVSLAKLTTDWYVKKGAYAPDKESLDQRARNVRRRLIEQFRELDGRGDGRRDIVIVSHGGILTHIMDDKHFAVPAAGWRTFAVSEDGEGDVKFDEIEGEK
ncbi:hypothetical protein DTO271G3_5125 [Paecilomyces variotii]|nr:hypothetical protein DTO271G3_5125 [Paecilomyces variotii]